MPDSPDVLLEACTELVCDLPGELTNMHVQVAKVQAQQDYSALAALDSSVAALIGRVQELEVRVRAHAAPADEPEPVEPTAPAVDDVAAAADAQPEVEVKATPPKARAKPASS